MSVPIHDLEDFIRANLPLKAVATVPEIRLHTAAPTSRLSRLDSDVQPYWAYPWGGGAALARYVLDHPACVAGKRVLDLGCGSGLVAIAAVLAGAGAVTANDLDPRACVAARLNGAANGVSFAVTEGDLLDGAAPLADVVLVGDVFYDPALALRSAAFLERCVAAGLEVLVGDPYRTPLPKARLRLVAEYLVADFGDDEPGTASGVFAFG